MAKRLRIGDVVEIPARTGLFYAQYTHSNAEYGALIRVLEGAFTQRPKDIQSLGLSPTRYVLFCFLQSAVNRGVWKVIPGKGSHRNYSHPLLAKLIAISGMNGDDARRYHEKAVRKAIDEVNQWRKATDT